MAGLVVFSSLGEALRAGFMVYDRTADGYIVRNRVNDRWQMAIANVRDGHDLLEPMQPSNPPAGLAKLSEPREWR